MNSNAEIISRVKYLIELSRMSQGGFARRLGVDPSNLSKHINGRLPMGDSLINRIIVETGVSRAWLRDGRGTPFDKQAEPIAIDLKPGQITDLIPGEERMPDGVPVYDIDVTAGFFEMPQAFATENVVGMVSLPNLNRADAIIRVSGDSMDPTIKNGGLIAIRPYRDMRNIFWGQIYVVVFDDYQMVKTVKRHPDDSKVILHSINPAYDDMDVDRADIRKLFIVETILNVEMRG